MRLFFIMLMLSAGLHARAQDKTILAKSEYMAAEEAYSNGNFEKCINHLSKSKEYFGGSNYLIQYLEVKALYGDGQIIASSKAIKEFFEIAPKESTNTLEYTEMVKMVAVINSKEEEVNNRFNEVLRTRNFKLAKQYLIDYPKARNASEIEKIMTEALEKVDADFGYGAGKTKAVMIGDQIWSSENLNVEFFANGDPIPEAKTYKEWERAVNKKQPAWCYYNNNPANGRTYGKLYNWYAVIDPRGVCPNEWHPPSDHEWSVVTSSLGGEMVAGTKIKSVDAWEIGGGDNSSGFAALPGGGRFSTGEFGKIGHYGIWWSTTGYTTEEAWSRSLYDTNPRKVGRMTLNKGSAFSVRCVKD
jgi:uncharacterized protein (TIGR02145 family)